MNPKQLQDSGVSIHAGFPNAANNGSHQKILDLNALLIAHPVATFFMQLDSNLWQDQGMFAGDIIIIDRALKPRSTDLIIWWEGEDFIIGPKVKAPKDSPTWGVVRSVIHQFRKHPAHER